MLLREYTLKNAVKFTLNDHEERPRPANEESSFRRKQPTSGNTPILRKTETNSSEPKFNILPMNFGVNKEGNL